MTRRIALLVTGLALVGHTGLRAQAGGGAEFLLTPMGARAVGMGRAYTGISNDIQAVAWNPAGLSLLQNMEVLYSRLQSFSFQGSTGEQTINYNLITVGLPVENYGSFGFSAEIQNLGDTDVTGPGDPTVIKVVSDRIFIFYGTYATPVFDKLDVGVDYKFVRVDFGSFDRVASTSLLDLGALYRPFDSIPLQVGASYRNLGFALQFKDEPQKDSLPRRLRVGAGYDVLRHLLKTDVLSLLVSSDVEMFRIADRVDQDTGEVLSQRLTSNQFFGGELGYNRLLYLRFGYIREKLFQTMGPSFGIGVNYRGIRFDLAREMQVSDLGDETHFTAGYQF